MDILNVDPNSLQALIFFLLPGFLTVLFFFYLIPIRKQSDLTIVIFSVIMSVFLTLTQDWIAKLSSLTVSPFILGIVFAIPLARLVRSKAFSFINRKILNIRVYPFGRLWNDFFDLPSNTAVKVFLDNKMVYVGIVRRSSVDPNDDIQELELWRPLYFDSFTTHTIPIKEAESVLLKGDSIVSVERISKTEVRKIYKDLET